MSDHNLSAYNNGKGWVIYCKLCGLEGDELSTSHCTGKVDMIVKEGVDKSDIDAYVNRMIAAS